MMCKFTIIGDGAKRDYFEKKVKFAIKKFKLLKKTDKIAVAVSGGKDSMSVLTILNKLGYNVTVISIDEGIFGYREKILDNVKNFCEKNNIKLKIYSFKKEFGKPLDNMDIKGSRVGFLEETY